MSKEQQEGVPPPYSASAPYNTGSPYPPPPPGFQPPQHHMQGYAPPPQGYSQQPYGPGPQQSGYTQANTVVVTQPTVTVVQVFRDVPVHTHCPHCRAEIITATHFETGTFTWVICCVLWFVGCGLGCCLIPFCMDGCKDVIHSCPNCKQQIARFSRL